MASTMVALYRSGFTAVRGQRLNAPLQGLLAKSGRRAFSGDVVEQVQRELEANQGVLVYGKSWCSFSMGAKHILESKGIDYTAHELDLEPQGDKIQAALFKITGQRTVPNIFIGDAHVGGYSDLVAGMQDGHVKELLEAVNIEMK